MGNIWKLYLYSPNMNRYDEGTGISFDKTTHSNKKANNAEMKQIVLDVTCTPATSTVNITLIADSTATDNYIAITIPHSNRQVATYPICIWIPDGSMIIYIHIYNLLWLTLPPEAQKAHSFQTSQHEHSSQSASCVIMVVPLTSTKIRSQFVTIRQSYSMTTASMLMW